jgi:hypothetical protein
MAINPIIRWSFCLAGIGFATSLSGCSSKTTNDYRVITQQSEKSRQAAEFERQRPSEPMAAAQVADATKVENNLMMSIPVEVPLAQVIPVSALEIANPLKVELLIPHKSFATDRKTGALRLTFDDINLLKVLNMDPVTDAAVSKMPEWLTSLEGKQVRIRGYMNPTFYAHDLERFVLLRDNQECCYGPLAKVYDNIDVRMKPGTTTDYISLRETLDVVGRFKIELLSTGDCVYGLYVIEDAAVITR